MMGNNRKAADRKRRDKRRRAAGGPVRLCRVQEFAFELFDTPIKTSRKPEVAELAQQAFDALYIDDGVAAERLLKAALAAEPGANDLQNNLCAAYEIQGRFGEAAALTREIHRRDPNYFFGRTNQAQLCIRQGDLEQATRLLEPLLQQRRLHITEFSALANAKICLSLASGQVSSARSWLKTWTEAVPNQPAQDHLRRDLALTPLAWLRRLVLRVRSPSPSDETNRKSP